MNNSVFRYMEHVGLGASDTAALSRWYCRVFGLRVLYESSDAIPVYFLTDASESFKIEIFPLKKNSDAPSSAAHLCFYTDDIHDAIAHLKREGVENIGEIRSIMNEGKTIFFPDPVGHVVQVVHRPKALWS